MFAHFHFNLGTISCHGRSSSSGVQLVLTIRIAVAQYTSLTNLAYLTKQTSMLASIGSNQNFAKTLLFHSYNLETTSASRHNQQH